MFFSSHKDLQNDAQKNSQNQSQNQPENNLKNNSQNSENISSKSFKPGVLTGKDVERMYKFARQEGFAIPAINCTTSSTINAVLEAAGRTKTPVIIQFSHGGAQFLAGKGLENDKHQASIAGAVAGAYHVHQLAKHYEAVVMLHTDHCDKKKLGWLDGLLKANLDFFDQTGFPLFSSHMLDLSQLDLVENVDICKNYLQKMASLGITLELELGITGGEEDGMDNSAVDSDKLYTQPEEVAYAYNELSQIKDSFFTIAASFGNVHGVYKPGNVHLRPEILQNSQIYIQEKYKTEDKPVFFVFHGGSGSEVTKIQEAVGYGVVKMNVDTDIQWAYWDGAKSFIEKNQDYLQSQLGNPEGQNEPNKEYYDPRSWLRPAEESVVEHIVEVSEILNSKGRMD